MARLRVQACTYNAFLAQGKGSADLSSWLLPTLSDEDSTQPGLRNPPDIIAVGFQ